jgi:exodeoxyribonuclease VII large subunit
VSPKKKNESQISFLETLEKIEAPTPRIWTVSELAKDLREHLKSQFNKIMVKGEISDFKGIHRSGHVYMGLKDESSQIRVVIWKGVAQKIPFELKMGLEVIISGSVDFYGAGGSLQINVESIEPVGIGSLQLKFEQLKEKLSKEGLFDPSRKKSIPQHVSRIGLVTGKSTAALQDMLKIFSQRYPLVELYFFQASVQGEQAPKEICAAIQRAEKFSLTKKLDILIIARGGGSYEDLFCFNDENIARAVAACSLPTISAVGHEIDFTICDFVADHRAATPSHAAQESTPDIRFIKNQIQNNFEKLRNQLRVKLDDLSQKIDFFWSQIISKAPHNRLKIQQQLVAQLSLRLQRGINVRLEQLNFKMQRYASTLEALSPLKVLERGYSIVETEKGTAVRSSDKIQTGELLKIRLHKGSILTIVKQKID